MCAFALISWFAVLCQNRCFVFPFGAVSCFPLQHWVGGQRKGMWYGGQNWRLRVAAFSRRRGQRRNCQRRLKLGRLHSFHSRTGELWALSLGVAMDPHRPLAGCKLRAVAVVFAVVWGVGERAFLWAWRNKSYDIAFWHSSCLKVEKNRKSKRLPLRCSELM